MTAERPMTTASAPTESAPTVDPSNADQARTWDGDQGARWAREPERFEGSVARYDAAFFDAARIGSGSRVLDVGCGTGATTREAARLAGPGEALGVDLSARMIAVARRAAADAGLGNVRFLQADAQIHPFRSGGFDVVVSRTGSMFFGDPVAAFGNLGRALRPRGRLTLLTWQGLDRNEWVSAIRVALAAGRPLAAPPPNAPGPFGLSDPGHITDVLRRAGFADITVDDVREPMDVGPTVDVAFEYLTGIAGWMLDGLDAARRSRALADLHATVRAHHTPAGVLFGSAAWLVVARRG